VAAQCTAFEQAGAAGVDLLAFCATDAEPLELVKAARKATQGTLVVAGSISSISQIEALAAAGVDAFTIGQAAFTGTISPRFGSLRSQLQEALQAAGETAKSSVLS
jgi:phosphoribosylformimino-5-aminoimidazole carboxamide ribonucleotide (ProFAR) isomerase